MVLVRYEIVFTGRVQRVGFRFTTVQIAGNIELTGWVRNEPDGSVRCVIEGQRAELDRFIAAVESRMSDYIAETRVESKSAEGAFDGFEIRGWARRRAYCTFWDPVRPYPH